MAEKEELDELKDMVQKLAERIEAGEKNNPKTKGQIDIQKILAEKENELQTEFRGKPDEKKGRSFCIANRSFEKLRSISARTGVSMSKILDMLIQNNL